MITSSQCHIGLRVKWVSVQFDIPISRGTVVHTSGNRFAVKWDDGDGECEDDGEDQYPTYDLNDPASRIYPLTRMVA